MTCRVLELARQPYYRWLADPVTDAELDQAYRAKALFDAHRDDPEFRYRFLADEARASGEPMADRTAWRICSAHGWWSVFGKKRSGKGTVGPPVHDDLVRRNFSANAPNRLWLSDISEHRTAAEGKLYICAVKDVYLPHSARIGTVGLVRRMLSTATSFVSSNPAERALSRRGMDSIRWWEVIGCVVGQ
ncbi:hypothetical protein ACFXPS_40885 [Nocardia sp. NPDC059091]|uniref:hypothetical protein n=1 Tax=unclassified Nocardia TaxID=2637762 RepID=UPI0036827192